MKVLGVVLLMVLGIGGFVGLMLYWTTPRWSDETFMVVEMRDVPTSCTALVGGCVDHYVVTERNEVLLAYTDEDWIKVKVDHRYNAQVVRNLSPTAQYRNPVEVGGISSDQSPSAYLTILGAEHAPDEHKGAKT